MSSLCYIVNKIWISGICKSLNSFFNEYLTVSQLFGVGVVTDLKGKEQKQLVSDKGWTVGVHQDTVKDKKELFEL